MAEISRYRLAKILLVRVGWLDPDKPTSSLVGRKFSFRHQENEIIGDIVSVGIDEYGMTKPRVSNESFNDHMIQCLIPLSSKEAFLECVDQEGKICVYKGTLTI